MILYKFVFVMIILAINLWRCGMSRVYDKLLTCYESVKTKVNFTPRVALILGSGLGELADEIDIKHIVNYNEIEGFPISTVQGHKGRFVFGYIENTPVVIMQGRIHYYEGYSMTDVVLPVRLMKLMGAEVLFLTNAAGGVNANFQAGDLMLIKDQISSFVPSPLIGENINELGTRFPDMSQIYNIELQELIKKTAQELNITLQEGVYVQFTGPNFESPTEVKMARILGGDAVGMSTGCEAVAANHMGLKICGISCISNLASGMTKNPLTHSEVQETADRVAYDFKRLVKQIISEIK